MQQRQTRFYLQARFFLAINNNVKPTLAASLVKLSTCSGVSKDISILPMLPLLMIVLN
jgi:hypothetical protein